MADKQKSKLEPASFVTQQEFRTLSDSVSNISGSIATWRIISGIATAAVLGAFGWSMHISNEVTAIQQHLSEQGVKLVAELKAPLSQEQLQANLATVTAQIETAKVQRKAPDPSKIQPLSAAISDVLKKNPELPSAWNTAMHLVNYRFQPTDLDVSSLPDCLHIPVTNVTKAIQGPPGLDGLPTTIPVKVWPGIPAKSAAMVQVKNCRLDLDDSGDFSSTNLSSSFSDAKKRDSAVNYSILDVTNAFITYRGGKLIPIDEIRFKQCFFDIQPTLDVPDRRRQVITQQLLQAKDNSGFIQLPNGM